MNDESEMKIKTKKFVSKQFKSSIKLQSSNSIYLRLVRWELTRMYSHFSCLIDYCCCTRSTSTATQHYYSLLYTTTGKLLELWLGWLSRARTQNDWELIASLSMQEEGVIIVLVNLGLKSYGLFTDWKAGQILAATTLLCSLAAITAIAGKLSKRPHRQPHYCS